jgi:hypothetical protein
LARFSALSLALLLAAAITAACGSGGEDSGAGPEESPTPADAGAIRDFDPARAPPVQTLVQQIGGGEIDPREVVYADLTQDGRDEAIVPVSSGGTLGNLGYVVLTMRSGAPAALLTVVRDRNTIGGITLALEEGRLVKTVGRYGPEDPMCCPSVLVKTTYYWDGSTLQVEGEREITQPTQKQ